MLYKLSRITAVLAILSLIVFFACRKNDFSSSAAKKNKAITDPSVALDIPLAKRYYKILRTDQGIDVSPTLRAPGSTMPNTRHPIWQRAVAGETSKAWFVEVPLFYNQKLSTIITVNDKRDANRAQQDMGTNLKRLNSSFNRLAIYKDKKTGQVDQRIITYMPDMEYLNKHGKDISNNGINGMDKNFSGFVIYQKWDGTPLFARKMKNGIVEKRLNWAKRVNQKSAGSREASTEAYVCDQICTEHWEQMCYVTVSGEFITEECGDWQLVGVDCDLYCYDDGSDPDPGGGPTGDPCIDYGDCGGDNPPDPPSDPPNDPCAHAKQLAADADFKNKMEDLETKTAQAYETLYLMSQQNGVTTYSEHQGGPSGVDFNFDGSFTDGSTGIIHNHENNPNNLSIFSVADLQGLYAAMTNPNIADKGNYTFGLVTASGTTYLLSVTDLQQFLTFGNENLTPAGVGAFNALYNLLINPNKTAAENESAFVTLLTQTNGGIGLTLMKGNQNGYNQWGQVTKANGTITVNGCN